MESIFIRKEGHLAGRTHGQEKEAKEKRRGATKYKFESISKRTVGNRTSTKGTVTNEERKYDREVVKTSRNITNRGKRETKRQQFFNGYPFPEDSLAFTEEQQTKYFIAEFVQFS